ncbi:D-ribitol-5-phosphate cytidylyltransferase isoform X2 [Gouania willdenowi]|uniref:D-ribitol-5-phosphate cytidylyltransferase n=1 Tax=Gouania willdenowi TaxID=441366 RepID=A0A8C5ED85_GOUWI|nr:D-ribitol-5-phosphate cytidylyltransferase isoform X2 [Gouania willdenowi]
MKGSQREPSRPAQPGTFPKCEPERSDPQLARLCVDFPVSVVLPAGGTGERTGLHTPKQFCLFMGRPLISYTIQAFERVSWIQNIVVVVAKENIDLMMDIVQRFQHTKVRAVPGGSTRHRSIYNGVLALGEEEEKPTPNVVIIHDAVRPFVEEEFLLRIAVTAKEHGAAGAIRPLVSTVIATTSEGYLAHSLDRAKHRASEMPQGFTYDIICQAYQMCSESDFEFGTECLHLALQYCGTNAKLIEGPPTLWKVTYKRDLAAAESIIKETLSKSACIITGGLTLAASLAASLQKVVGSLDMELDIIPDLKGDNARYLSKKYNFIQISVEPFSPCEVEAIVVALESKNQALLHPVAVIWVYLSTAESSISRRGAETPTLMDLALAAKLHNIFLYGIQIHHSKDSERWERSVLRLAEITSALIQERSPALVGQLLQA